MSAIPEFRIVILGNENAKDHEEWLSALLRFSDPLEFEVIDITKYDWLNRVEKFKPDICLLKPSGTTSAYRILYQERVEVLFRDLGLSLFPSYDELRVYENKRYLSYWLKANKIPHPETYVFYSKKEALSFVELCDYPIVTKINIGASGRGVRIIQNRRAFVKYLDQAFANGVVSKTGPNLKKGHKINRFVQKIKNPKDIFERINHYKAVFNDKQKGFVIVQEYIQHDFEWRVVRIGDSFFAHKKLKQGEKASGTLLKNYDTPPILLLQFIKELTDRFSFRSVAVDCFETVSGGYLVNEIQCIFGQSDSFQMKVNGIIGRYIFMNGEWIFEEGDFARNACYDLRLEYIIKEHSKAL